MGCIIHMHSIHAVFSIIQSKTLSIPHDRSGVLLSGMSSQDSKIARKPRLATKWADFDSLKRVTHAAVSNHRFVEEKPIVDSK